MRITGTMLNYYFVCRRKLWLFYNNISFENESDKVLIGKLIDESTYERESKHIMIDETVNIDFIKDWAVLHEVKKSKSIEEASIWQVKYYIYFLNQKGIPIEKGILDYPVIKKRQEVKLQEHDAEKIEEILGDINSIVLQKKPPPNLDSKICKSCAYYEYCYI